MLNGLNKESKPYCVYLTIYSGDVLPKFYIGSKDTKSVIYGYRGSVSSKKWKNLWKQELKNNPNLFETQILAMYDTRKEAFDAEDKMQREVNAIESDEYINEAYASRAFHCKPHTEQTKSKMRESRIKFLQTVDKQHWYENTAKKQRETRSKKWKCAQQRDIMSKNISKGQNDRSDLDKSIHARKISVGWKNRPAEKRNAYSKKRSEITSNYFKNLTPEQRDTMSKQRSEMFERVKCPHCDKVGIKPNMKRWHFDNCKILKANTSVS